MSDTKLRELERRWKETGAVDDEAAYLLERVRVGDLTQERLELAAYCGHEGARRALGPAESLARGAERVLGLSRWGKATCVRLALAAARHVMPLWDRRFPEDRRPQAVIEAVDEWLKVPGRATKDAVRDPCSQARQAAEQAGELMRRETDAGVLEETRRARLVAGAAAMAGGAVHYPRVDQSAEAASRALENATLADSSTEAVAFAALARRALENQPPGGGG